MSTRTLIVHVIGGLPIGGAEIALWRLLGAMDRERFENRVIALGPSGPVAEWIRGAGVEVRSLGLARWRSAPRALGAVIELLRAARPTIVQTWMYHANAFGTVAARVAGAHRLVWNLRAAGFLAQGGSREVRMASAFCALATRTRLGPDAVISNSNAGRAEHRALGYRTLRWEVIANGFDLERLRPDPAAREQVRSELGLGAETPLVGHFARLDPMKDHGLFLDAIARVRADLPGVHCALAGRGVESSSTVARAADRLGLTSCTHLLGERVDIPRLLPAFDVIVSSSAYGEGFSNAIGEAMACGVPCVVTDVGDSATIVGATGLVVPPRNPSAVAAAVRSVLETSPEQRRKLGDAARARIRERFALHAMVARYESLYAELSSR